MPDCLNIDTSAIVTVGDGRGFIVQATRHRFVITAGHCLPFLPPSLSVSYTEERTYEALLGPLGGERKVWAECLFADAIGDLAILGPPDNQELWDQAEDYVALMETPFSITDPPRGRSPAWLLSLEDRWYRCTVSHNGGMLGVLGAAEGIVGGMSGSPIVANDGSAIGVICTSGGTGEVHTEGGPNPRLVGNLPGWLLHQLSCALGG